MKRKHIIITIILIVVIILEALPYGAVLNFANPDAETCEIITRKTYSYFDLTPYGYANFGPLLTAILSCILLILSIISLFKGESKSFKAFKILSVIAVITSLMPLLMFGIESYSLVAGIITVLLVTNAIISFIKS